MRMVIVSMMIILSLSGCGTVRDWFAKPRPWGLGETPDGPPNFKQGWEDGCDTGLGVYGARHYNVKAYRFRQDPNKINDPVYYRAWKDAYTYCRWYVWNWSRPWREYHDRICCS